MIGLGLSLTQIAARGRTSQFAYLGGAARAIWDPRRTDKLVLASGSLVTSWTDVARGQVLSQSFTAQKPVWLPTGFNGGPGIGTDGVDDCLELLNPSLPASSASSIILMLVDQLSSPADATSRVILSHGGGSTPTRRGVQRNSNGSANTAAVVVGDGVTTGGASAIGDFSGRHLLRAEIGNPSSSITLDGGTTTAQVSAVPATGTERLRVGANSNTAAGNYALVVFGLIILIDPTQPEWTPQNDAKTMALLKSIGGTP